MKYGQIKLNIFVFIVVISLIATVTVSGVSTVSDLHGYGQSTANSSLLGNQQSNGNSSASSLISGHIGSAFSNVASLGQGLAGGISGVGANSAIKYTVTFDVTNKAAGTSWSVYLYTNLSLSTPDLPLYNSLYGVNYGLVFSQSSTSSTMTASIPSGTYYYYDGPTSTITGPYQLVLNGTKSVSVTFPYFYNATFSESGLATGGSWDIYGTANLPDGRMTIITGSSTSSTVSVHVPNGYYDFAYGVGSMVIESDSFLVSGSNISRQLSIPSLYLVTFNESGLKAGTSWQVYGETLTPNTYSFNDFFVKSSTSANLSVELPNGAYFYRPSAENTSFTVSNAVYVDGSNQQVSITFSPLIQIKFTGSGYRTGIDWQVSAYSTNGTVSAVNYSTSSALYLDLPAGSYTYTSGEGGSNFVTGDFNFTSTGVTVPISFPATYNVNVSETGLQNGMNWGITIYSAGHVTAFTNATVDSHLSIFLPSGKYNYTISESPINTVLYQQDQSIYSYSSFSLGTGTKNINVTFPRLTPINFTESNLKSGLTWGIGIYSTSSSTGFSEVYFNTSSTYPSVSAYLMNGSFYYSVEESNSYFYPSYSTFVVTGAEQNKAYQFPDLYQVTFSITGLKASNTWSLTVDESNFSVEYTNSSAFATMVAYLPNASYNYTVTTTSHLTNGSSFSVSGNARSVSITIAASYTIKFTETGLPSGTLWYVSINGTYSFSSNSTIQMSEPNGTYQYSVVTSSYISTPSNGTVLVAGKDISLNVTFTQSVKTYPITFSETGLPAGTSWSVTISNSTESSIHASLILQEPNGTYTYEINATGFSPTPSAGLLTINGSSKSVDISFEVMVPVTKYNVTFTESGLASNTQWTVSLTNSTNAGTVIGKINTTSLSVDVYGITYDGSNRYLYASGIVHNSTSSTRYPGVVLVISPLTDSIISSISVGSLPESSAYDPYNGYVYVANSLSDNVSVINTATETVIATIPVGIQPVGITYSSTNHNVYVANSKSGTVSVINGTSNLILTTISLGASGETVTGAVFDPSNGNVYVGGFNNQTLVDSVFVISTTTNTLVTTIQGAAYFGVYDPLNGYLYFTDKALDSILVVDGATNRVVTTIALPSHSSPVGITFDSYDHYIYVAAENSSSLSVINSLTNTLVANIELTGYPLFPTYNPTDHSIYVSNLLAGGIQVVSSYGGISTVLSSKTDQMEFSEPNGTYTFVVASVNGYSISPQTGSMTVSGSQVSEAISFSEVLGYEVTFSQTGLRSGTSWSVTLGVSTISSTQSSITFTETNGSYAYKISNVTGYEVTPLSGVITISGSSVTKSVTFSELFPVNFVESNLPAGSTWTVTFAGISETSSSSTISFEELNGTYSFSVNSSSNYNASPPSGSISVDGYAINQSVQFSPMQLHLYLTGTISPTNATLYVNGQAVTTKNGTFNVSVLPGSYDIKVVSPGYKTYYQNVTVASNQSSVSVLNIALNKQPTPATLPVLYILIIVVVVAVVIALVAVIASKAKRKS